MLEKIWKGMLYMNRIIKIKDNNNKVHEHNSGDGELDLYISNELKSKDKVSAKVDARIDDTLKMIMEQREILVTQEYKARDRENEIKTKRRKMKRGIVAAAGVLIVGISVWQRSAIIKAAGELYYYIYGEGKVEADEEETDAVYYLDKEINLGENGGIIKFISWHNNELVFIRYLDEYDTELPPHLLETTGQFRYSEEKENSLFFGAEDKNGQFNAEFVKEVYYTDKTAGETLTLHVGETEYIIDLEKSDLHQAGEVQDQIELNRYDMSFLPLGNTGRAYYIDKHIYEQFSDYEIYDTRILSLSDNGYAVNHHSYFQFDDMIYFNEDIDYDEMTVESSIGIDLTEIGYENLPHIELPVPENGETISIQKDYYAGTKNGKDHTIYIDKVFRSDDTFFVYFAKEKEKEDAKEQPQVDFAQERSYEEFVETSCESRSDQSGELTELSLKFQDGTLEELSQKQQKLPFVCTGIAYHDMQIVEVR